MSINKRYSVRVGENPPTFSIVQPFTFTQQSPYYHQEEWREVTDWMAPGVRLGCYKISNYGRVASLIGSTKYPNGAIMSPSVNGKGYFQITFQSRNINPENGKPGRICCKISRLVMMAFAYFLGCELYEVDHIDDDSSNNCFWNLQWVTPRENTRKAILYGDRYVSMSNTGNRLLTDEEAQAIFNEASQISYAYEMDIIAEKYNVSRNIVKALRNGSMRPYFKRQFLMNGGKMKFLGR